MTRRRRYGRRLPTVMLTLCLLASTSCAKNTAYLQGGSQAVPVSAGQVAPHDGWLLSDAALADLLECCAARVD